MMNIIRSLGSKKRGQFIYLNNLFDFRRVIIFVKFCLNERGEKFGLVAGKSASKNVIRKSDLNFSTNPDHGPARRWLIEVKKEWCQTEVIIIGAKAEENKDNRKEAFQYRKGFKGYV